MSIVHRVVAGAAIVLSAGPRLSAQSLADRVAAAAEPRVQFTFAARDGVCGNGRSFIQVSGSQWYGSWSDTDRQDACTAGPVRVLLDRAGREVVSLATFAGPVPERAAGVADLGRVRTREAAEYLLGLAERSTGRVSRDAILPAALADSVDIGPRLLAIARNQNAARETRRSAISWLGRTLAPGERNVKAVADALVAIARDEDDNRSVRQAALRTLARLEHGTGTPLLMDLARDAQRSWLAREALTSLNSSGDPRARQHLREVVRRGELPDDVLAAAIRGLGGEYATGDDIGVVRQAFTRLPGDRSREAAVSAVANFGGADNVRWLLALAANPDQRVATRRRAVQHAYRGGASVVDLVRIYDETTDLQLKEAVIASLVESGEKQATDKLMQIARSDENRSARRRAISALSRSSDARVKEFLAQLVER